LVGGWQFFSSTHTGIINFCMGDGSVRGIRQGGTGQRNPAAPTWWVLLAMSGKADSVVLNDSAL
jgi:hypothetical protein